jgi:hypothetical protein
VKALLISALALLAALTSLGATSQDSHDTYMPGAIVTLAVEVEAPEEWKLNPAVPLRLQFDQQAISKLNLKIDKASWDFKVAGHDETYTAQVPVKISPKQAAGAIEIPVKLACSICTTDQSSCTFVDQELSFKLNVQGKGQTAPGGTAPAKKGRFVNRCALVPPEL